MPRPPTYCDFCGRHADDCPAGLYAPAGARIAICVYCARLALQRLDAVYAAAQAGKVTDLASRRASRAAEAPGDG